MDVRDLLTMDDDTALGTFVAAVALNTGTITQYDALVIARYYELFRHTVDVMNWILAGEMILRRTDGRYRFERLGPVDEIGEGLETR